MKNTGHNMERQGQGRASWIFHRIESNVQDTSVTIKTKNRAWASHIMLKTNNRWTSKESETTQELQNSDQTD